VWELAHQKPGQQKTADPNQEAAVKRGEIFVQRIFPRCTSKGTRPSATVGFLRPRLAALVAQCVPDAVMTKTRSSDARNGRLCHKRQSNNSPKVICSKKLMGNELCSMMICQISPLGWKKVS
jgi:hypothetical protein